MATDAGWEKVTVVRYGRTESVYLAEVRCIWYGSFGNTAGRCVLVREEGSAKPYDLALFTVDMAATAAGVVRRYAVRWSIEPSNAVGKQQMGVGQARNRVPKAVERTVPFGMLVQSMVIVWYALHGYHPDDVAARRLAEPWYESKTEPSFEGPAAGAEGALWRKRCLVEPLNHGQRHLSLHTALSVPQGAFSAVPLSWRDRHARRSTFTDNVSNVVSDRNSCYSSTVAPRRRPRPHSLPKL